MSRYYSVIFPLLALFGMTLVSLVSIPAHAQTDPTTDASAVAAGQSTGVDPFTVDVSPQYPTPYSTITLSPASTIFDITNASISVTLNGTNFYSGYGGTGISVPLGGPGSTNDIIVTAVAGGQTYSQEIVLRPVDVALVVEPVSTTHPFYDGASLVPSEGHVRLVAVPDFRTPSGTEVNPSALVYSWSLGDQALDSASGMGKSVLDAVAPQRYRDADVSVTVQTQDGSLIAQANTTISPVDPVSRIYEEDPLLGPLFDNALTDSFTMADTEDTFLGVPYYFSSTPTLDWTMNGTDSASNADITVRSTGNGTGTAVLGFSANDTSTTQTANSTLSVLFGNNNSTGIFGL